MTPCPKGLSKACTWERNVTFIQRSVVGKVIFLWIFLCCSACDNQGAQSDFVEEASLPPGGITRILDNDFGGTVCSEDPDDWRISPVYASVVFVEQASFPNPISGSSVGTILLRVLQLDRVQGGFVLNAFGQGNTPIELGRILDASSPGTYELQYAPSLLVENGLHRLFIFDSLGELVTYGDVELVTSLPSSC